VLFADLFDCLGDRLDGGRAHKSTLALSSVIGFFCGRLLAGHRPQVRAALEVRTALATAADRREAYAYGQRNSV
jgi:hypothetical protein